MGLLNVEMENTPLQPPLIYIPVFTYATGAGFVADFEGAEFPHVKHQAQLFKSKVAQSFIDGAPASVLEIPMTEETSNAVGGTSAGVTSISLQDYGTGKYQVGKKLTQTFTDGTMKTYFHVGKGTFLTDVKSPDGLELKRNEYVFREISVSFPAQHKCGRYLWIKPDSAQASSLGISNIFLQLDLTTC